MARVKDGIATVMLDATGLSAEQRAGLERQVRAATIAIPGVTDTRVAMTAEKMQRTIIAIGSGKGGVGKSTVSGQYRGGAGADGQEGRPDRRRHLRPLAAADHGQCEPPRAGRPADRPRCPRTACECSRSAS
jgi:hypothetical protein